MPEFYFHFFRLEIVSSIRFVSQSQTAGSEGQRETSGFQREHPPLTIFWGGGGKTWEAHLFPVVHFPLHCADSAFHKWRLSGRKSLNGHVTIDACPGTCAAAGGGGMGEGQM